MPLEGKEGMAFMERVVYSHLGAGNQSVRVGPGVGLDNAVVSAGGGRVIILTVDPISMIPTIGVEMSAWMSVHLIASDYTTSGADPELATFAYNFPRKMSISDRESYVKAVGSECAKLGVSIVAGHTGSYPGAGFTVIGAGSMVGFASERGFLTPAMAREGDVVLLTKHAGIEATCSIALAFPKFVQNLLGKDHARKARAMVGECSTVADARAARRIGLGKGGVTAMHDCTEGGVLGAASEMAAASGRLFEVRTEDVPVASETRLVCEAFGLEPLTTMGEGALLITCAPGRAQELRRTLARRGVPAAEIGTVRRGGGLVLLDGKKRRPFRPGPDRYWRAYAEGIRRRLK